MNIAIIPARGGSKRLPGKNIRLLHGKPMISWTIEAALESGVFDFVYVSTDCEDIASVAENAGATVPYLRPEYLSSDEASTYDVIIHLVQWLGDRGKDIQSLCLLQPTSPLRSAKHISEAKKMMVKKNASAIVSVCKLGHPPQFCNTLGSDGCLDGFIKPENIMRTQDFGSYYRLNGAIYFLDRECIGRFDNLYVKGTYAYEMSSRNSVDVDSLEDFELAEFYMSL